MYNLHVLEVRHLQLVAAIVDEGNLTRAGERLHLTQSALSHQLLDIEERLGTPLFHRVNKKMALTEAGQRVLDSARRILQDIAKTEDDLRLYASHRKGTVRLTTQCYTGYHWLPALMQQFEKKYPEVEISIDVDATDTPLDAVREGTLDVAFVTADSADPGITLEPLFTDEVRVIVAPHHRFATRPYVRAHEVLEETLLTYSDLKTNIIYDQLLVSRDLEPKKHLQVRLTEAMIEFIKAGVGVAVMAQWAVAPYVAAGSVVAVPLTKRGVERQWKAAYLASRPMPPFVRAFIDMIAAQGPRAQRMAITLPLPRRRA